ncbi:MAG TPA: amino acid adenylation domain-containing protein [Pyrinomonadaceae bacterium]
MKHPGQSPAQESAPASLVELLRRRAFADPRRKVYTFLEDGERIGGELTLGELDEGARAVGAWLQARGAEGARVLLVYPPGLEFVRAFFGCLYAGAVAVPVPPPRLKEGAGRLRAVAADAGARFVLTTGGVLSMAGGALAEFLKSREISWLESEALGVERADKWREPASARADGLAYLQYTSGSTAEPKGVMVSHGNVLANSAHIYEGFVHTAESVALSWLPHFHDMGLVGGIIQPLYGGFRALLMPPASFLQSPMRWLRAVKRHGVTITGGPNFAYDLCVRKVTPEQRAELDLSSWRVAYNGAEPVRADTIKRFSEFFAPCGFRERAFYPTYGLAEATLKVTGGRADEGPVFLDVNARDLEQNRAVEEPSHEAETRTLIGAGRAGGGTRVEIVDPEAGEPCGPERVGEIWVSGPGVASGYWNRPEETQRTFRARLSGDGGASFLRTGDLGFIKDGTLFVTGRLKDLIIIRGRNLYPQDIEQALERCHAALRPAARAAFSVEAGGEERLVVVQEVERRRPADWDAVVGKIREEVTSAFEVQAYAVVLVRPGGVPRTSSGKIRRGLCRQMFLENGLDVLLEWHAPVAEEVEAFVPSLVDTSSAGSIEGWLQQTLAARLGLTVEEVDVRRPLVFYGVDSLTAVEMAHALETALGVSVPMANLLQGESLAEVAAHLIELRGGVAGSGVRAPVGEDVREYPLSRGQQALWFLQRMAPDSTAYNIAVSARVRGLLEAETLRDIFLTLADRHDALRTTFGLADGVPVQRVLASPQVSFEAEDAAGWSEESLRERLHAETHRPFDLERDPLWRVRLFRRPAGEHVLLLVTHHIISDFWSLAVLMHELGALHEAHARGESRALEWPRPRFADYVRWQGELLGGAEGTRLREFWHRQLGDAPSVLNLPTDRPRPPVQTYRGAARDLTLSAELTTRLKELGRRQGCTLYTTLLAAFQVLLHRYTGEDDLLVGTPTTGRGRAGFSEVVGYFVNPLVMRADLTGRPTFEEFLGRVRRAALDAFAHQDYPFASLVESLRPERDPSRSPLFQVMFVFHKVHLPGAEGLTSFALGAEGARVNLGGLELEPFELERRVAQFDLTLTTAEIDGRLGASLEYNTDLFDTATAARMLAHFQHLLESVVDAPWRSVSALPLLDADERRLMLSTWNDTRRGYDLNKCLHELFEEQAERTPSSTALVHGDERLTYAELNGRAEQLAERLRRLGVGPEVPVGLLLERTPEVVVALLAVLKAGGAYVPLDPAYPARRLAFILEDASLPLLLTRQDLARKLPPTRARVVALDVDEEGRAPQRVSRHRGRARGANLAYVIYTSGSTGRPKGVAIEHASAVSLVNWAREQFSKEELSRVLASTSLCFDLSVFELFAPLSCGGAIILAENALHLDGRGPHARPTLVNTVPSAMAELLRLSRLPDSVRAVNLAGEPLTNRLAQEVYERSGAARVLNLYGPSETTTYSTAALVARGDKGTPSVGRPISNTQIYILDEELEPVPVGVRGELYIGGAGVARGYLNRPALTAEKFIPDSFVGEPGARMYRTGDLARYLSGGEIDFLGRADQQVKVRGFRIELEEIEAAMLARTGVREAVVLTREDVPGDKRLVAYFVADEERSNAETELRASLQERLPAYMLPSSFVRLDALPLTPNGKVDRKALPAPTAPNVEREHASASPLTTTEEMLAGVWCELLGVERVGADDNFFDLGGHSLLAARMTARVREALGVNLALLEVFKHPTPRELARRIEDELNGGRAAVEPPLTRSLKQGAGRPLSFAQQRLWFLQKLEPESAAYNMAAAVRLRGALDVHALERALAEVVRRHDSLRTTFEEVEGRPVQIVHAHAEVRLVARDAGRDGEAEAAARRPFELSREPPLRPILLRHAADEHTLLLVLHHIVCDGWSLANLFKELSALYGAFKEGRPTSLPPLPVQYADFAEWQLRSASAYDAQLDYWRAQLEGAPALHELPTDRPRRPAQLAPGEALAFELPTELTRELKALGRAEGATMFVVLLAAWQLLVARYSGREDVVTGTPVADRDRGELEGLVGLFLNTLAVRTRVPRGASFRELLRDVKEAVLGAHAHRKVPFERLVEELHGGRAAVHAPLFQLMFVLQNAPEPRLELPGLEVRVEEVHNGSVKFDLTLSLREESGALRGSLEYNTDLFERATVARMLEHFRNLLEAAVREPARSVCGLPLLNESERRRLLLEWNNAARVEAPRRSLHELFAEQVRRTPDAVAVVSGEESVTYRELDAKAARVARRLREMRLGPEARVGVCAGRSLETVAALLGVLKAGAAYVPLDPNHPPDRLSFMLEDARVAALLTRSELTARLPSHDAPVILLDSDLSGPHTDDAETLPAAVTADQTAYVMYTSGTTGRPKGVCCSHTGVVNLLSDCERRRPLGPGDRCSFWTNTIFDVSVYEIFSALLGGAALYVVPEEVLPDAARFIEYLRSNEITSAYVPPFMLRELAAWLAREGNTLDLRRLLVGVEPIAERLLCSITRDVPGLLVINGYGPTEAAVCATLYNVPPETANEGNAPIGRPVRNARIYILDEELEPVPLGVHGELYVGGAGVARGYLNRPALTAEKFIPDPYSTEPGARMYRTGDVTRYLPGGDVEFVGRADHQVKVRGVRVELEEIEAVLKSHTAVVDAVVIADAGPGAEHVRLLAFVRVADVGTFAARELLEYVRGRVPDYMLPARFVPLASLPLTPTGKVDRKALAAMKVERQSPASATDATATTPHEELLAGIWAEVLCAERVGVDDNFFELGGHSLLATQVVSRVRGAFGVELPLRRLFEAPTVAELASEIDKELSGGRADELPPLTRHTPRGAHTPLSFAQQRLWFLQKLEPKSPAYNIAAEVRLSGRLDVDALERALNAVVRRHDSLRTTFGVVDEQPSRIVAANTDFRLALTDLSMRPERERESAAERVVAEESRRPFDLTTDAPLRVGLLRLSTTEHRLLLTVHHAVADGWSAGLLLRETAALYNAFTLGLASPLTELKIQYADFARWQRELMEAGVFERQAAYWRRQLRAAPSVLALPTDRPRPRVQSLRGATHEFEFDNAFGAALKELSRREGVTLFMTLLAAFQTLLARYTSQADILVGTPVAGRNRAETESVVGLFVNTLVMRGDLSGNPRFDELLRRVRETCLEAYANQDVPFERVVEDAQTDRQLSHTPLFQVMFVLQNAPGGELCLEGLDAELRAVGTGTAKFDLTLSLTESDGRLAGVLEYNTDLFDAATARRIARHYRTLLSGLAAHPEARIGDAPLLEPEERSQTLSAWSNTDTSREFAEPALVHQLFERQASRTPSRVAVESAEGRLTYAELNARANRIARHLLTLGVGAGTLVGVLMERTPEMVAALLGVLKAGAAYVPLDAQFPPRRLAYMLEDSAAPVLLTEERFRAALADTPARLVYLDAERETIAQHSNDELARDADEESPAYVIYTSGSTGRPKGVVVPHRAVVNFLRAMRREPGLDEADTLLAVTTLSFDIAALEIFLPLTVGARVRLASREVASDATLLAKTLADAGATVMQATPATWRMLVESGWREGSGLKMLCGGEALPRELADELLRRGQEVWNLYGPTETAIWSSALKLEAAGGAVPIGRPIANTRLRVLDASMNPVPVGVYGELYIGGRGLAHGYLNRPALTAERFVPDPFDDEHGARLYRTGDLVRHLDGGALEFAGRLDQQVKLRGFRIELEEIEAAVNRHESVREAVVVAREVAAGDSRLVAYVVSEGGATDAAELRRALKEFLPDYMLPSSFVFLDALPLTPNGKVDRKALPAPEESEVAARAHTYVAPRDETEAALAAICAGLLGVGEVGINDNFFELGGHSLLAMQLMTRLRSELSIEIPLRQFFENPTVAGLSEAIAGARESAPGPPLVRVERGDALPLSFAQQRLWFINQLDPQSAAYNMPTALRLKGRLRRDALEEALNEVVGRHEILRTTYAIKDRRPVQVVHPPSSVGWSFVDLSATPADERDARARELAAAEARKPFDLARGPILRASLIRLAEDEHVALFNVHHIAADGGSGDLLLREFSELYAARVRGVPANLPPLAVQYADFAAWQREWVRGEVLEKQLEYWRRQLKGAARLTLPTDRPRPPRQSFRGAAEPFALTSESAESLRRASRREGVTLFVAVLAAYQTLLARLAGQEDILVGTSVAARNRPELEDLIGFFANTVVVRTDLSGEPNFRELLRRVRESVVGAYAHQDAPFEKVLEALAVERSAAYNPLFQVGLTMQGGGIDELSLPDLEVSRLTTSVENEKFDLTLRVRESGGGLTGEIGYATDLFERATVRRMADELQSILAAMADGELITETRL